MENKRTLYLLTSFGIVSLLAVSFLIWLTTTPTEHQAMMKPLVGQQLKEEAYHPHKGTFTDPRDGQKYATIKLFNQVWLAQNLNFDPGIGSTFCYNNEDVFCAKYGRLYNWKAAQTACPKGWRIPKDDDWNRLYVQLGHVQDCYKALIKGGYMGFDALLGGWRAQDLTFRNLEERAYFWSSSIVQGAYARYYRLDTQYQKLSSDNAYQEVAFSCRCVKE